MDHPFDALVGHWNTTGENVPGGAEAAISIKGMDRYEWLPGKKFLIHRADVWMGDEKVDVIEVVGPCGDDLTAIPMHSFDNEGNHALMHARRESPTTWVFSGETLRTRLIIDEGGRVMTARWERRVDGRHWAHWLNMRFEKTT